MKCLYCKKDCIFISKIKIAKKMDGSQIDWTCKSCNVKYCRVRGGGLISTRWNNIIINEREFMIKLYNGVSGNAPEMTIYYKVFPTFMLPYGWIEVIRFDFIPQSWTPQNIVSKLQIYLPFL